MAAVDPFDEGVFCRSRFWLLAAYGVSGAAVVSAVAVMLHQYALPEAGESRAAGSREEGGRGPPTAELANTARDRQCVLHEEGCCPDPGPPNLCQPTPPLLGVPPPASPPCPPCSGGILRGGGDPAGPPHPRLSAPLLRLPLPGGRGLRRLLRLLTGSTRERLLLPKACPAAAGAPRAPTDENWAARLRRYDTPWTDRLPDQTLDSPFSMRDATSNAIL